MKDKSLIGAAGEHLVLSRLLSRGFLAAPAPRGTRKVDILVNFIDGGNPVLVQVKSTLNPPTGGWPLSAKYELIDDEDLIFCFVSFSSTHPAVFVVPSSVVANHCRVSHQTWLETPGKKGQAHKDSNMRQITNRAQNYGAEEGWMDTYLEAWEQIGTP